MRWYGWVAILVTLVGVAGWFAWGRLSEVVALKPDGPEEEAALAFAEDGVDKMSPNHAFQCFGASDRVRKS